ncbi:MAG TPA: hypothetical protein VGS57_18430 [Thermoanaerobaculia bacterium]|jgi:hypothetical protein|nr:hypothetical protein [Thermoanaerobaculia bacterium]
MPTRATLFLDFDLPPGNECTYLLSAGGEVHETGHLTATTSVGFTNLPAGRYRLEVTTADVLYTFRLRVSTQSKQTPRPSPTPLPSPETSQGCPQPSDVGSIVLGRPVNGTFGTEGKSARQWLTFSLRGRTPVHLSLTIWDRHPMRLVLANARGCTLRATANIERTGAIDTTLAKGAYFIRVYTNTPRREDVHFTVALSARREEAATEPPSPTPPPPAPAPAPSRSPQPPPIAVVTPPPPPPPPLPSPVLRCREFDVQAGGEWLVVVDPIEPNGPPNGLSVVVTGSAGTAPQLAGEQYQPCLLTPRYRLKPGHYRACVVTSDPVGHRPEVAITTRSAAEQAPTTRVVRDCE